MKLHLAFQCLMAVLFFFSTPARAEIDCRLIDCDCDSIEAGILTRPWREHCQGVENQIIEACNNGQKRVACDSVRGDGAWPVNADQAPPKAEERVEHWTQKMQTMDTFERAEYWARIRPQIEPLAQQIPALRLVDRAASASLDGLRSYNKVGDAMFEVAGENYLQGAREIVDSAVILDASGAENAEQLYDLAKLVERLAAAGIGIGELTEGNTSRAKLLEKAAKWARLGASAEELRQHSDRAARDFVDSSLSLIPREVNPALASPVGKFFRDLMQWDSQMWRASTDGLDVVARAIETGHFDEARYEQVHQRLEHLSETGPWTPRTALDFVKKGAEEIPVIGKLLKALWG